MQESFVQECGLRMMQMLDDYISIHNELLDTTWGARQDYDGYALSLEQVQANAKDLLSVISKRNKFPASEEAFLVSLQTQYLPAVLEAVSQLYTICLRLDDKAEGSRYSLLSYFRDMRRYRHAEEKYKSFGFELNRLYDNCC